MIHVCMTTVVIYNNSTFSYMSPKFQKGTFSFGEMPTYIFLSFHYIVREVSLLHSHENSAVYVSTAHVLSYG